jgi:3-hydroxyacyl-[acyl-carrier-protein] dehydratase
MVMEIAEVLSKLPYTAPFLFVDGLTAIDENGVTGFYTFNADSAFYQGHFKNYPVTPGVLLTETMAQIGLACLGIYLVGNETEGKQIFMTSANVAYLKPVFPGEKVTVVSTKKYFRFNKLQCEISMFNANGDVVCKGILDGMFIPSSNGQ